MGLELVPARSMLGGPVTRGTDWCGSSQVPWPTGLTEECGKWGLELSPQGMGLLWACSQGRPPSVGPQRALACLPNAGLLGLGLHPCLQAQPPAWVPRLPQRHFVRGWLPCHCFCGTGRLRPCHSTIWHHPRKWLLGHQDDACLSSSRTLCVAHFLLSLP